MIRLRPEQVASLNQLVFRQGRDSVAAWLLRTYPEKFGLMSGVELTAAVDERIGRALSFGFETAEDAATYLDCAMRFTDDFPDAPEHAAYAKILYDAGSTSVEKLHALELAVFPESVTTE